MNGRSGPWVAACLLFALAGVPRMARAQEAADSPSGATATVDPVVLQKIRRALSSPRAINYESGVPRFYSFVLAKQPTFADYLKATHTNLYGAPILPAGAPWTMGARGGGGGIGMDPGQLVNAVRQMFQRRQAAQIRERIDKELEMIEEKRKSEAP